jgi:hypothetical protein
VATKGDFDQDEWQQLLEMPWVAGVVVIVADPSWRIVGEFKAMAAAVVADVSPGPAETLIKELVSGMEADQTDFDNRDDDSESEAEMLEILRQCGVVIAARCTDNESTHLREWVLGVARATAQARREGGFLGIGSVRVSDDERAAISKIDAALTA